MILLLFPFSYVRNSEESGCKDRYTRIYGLADICGHSPIATSISKIQQFIIPYPACPCPPQGGKIHHRKMDEYTLHENAQIYYTKIHHTKKHYKGSVNRAEAATPPSPLPAGPCPPQGGKYIARAVSLKRGMHQPQISSADASPFRA